MARGFITQYRCYNYVNKNPVIDKTRTILQDEGLYSKKRRRILSQLSGVAVSTYDNLFEGDTKNPKHTTIAATMAAIGYEEKFVKTRSIDEEKELELARKWNAKQKELREKVRASGNGKAKQSNGSKRGKKA
jgi:hypothetical protein